MALISARGERNTDDAYRGRARADTEGVAGTGAVRATVGLR